MPGKKATCVPSDATRARLLRSALMGRVRQKGTGAELNVRAALRKAGFRYRSNVSGLAGRPDLVNRELRIAIFVHGCFWHRHARCRRATTPKTNVAFWQEKFLANVSRDRRKARALRQQGYRVLTVWECEALDSERLARIIARRLTPLRAAAGAKRRRLVTKVVKGQGRG
jgi:DNA mismatch endonuclease (patch repair protein)